MRLEHIPQKFKQAVWKAISSELDETEDYCTTDTGYNYYGFSSDPNIGTILYDYEYHVLGKFHDDIPWYENIRTCRSFFNELICKDNDDNNYHNILTVIEFILHHDACPESLYKSLIDAFNNTSVAYFIEKIGGVPTLIPRTSPESREATRQAIETIQQVGPGGASTHLRQAAEHIKARQYADSIADSIHAVESVARLISPKEAKTLVPALNSLENAGVIKHKALKGAFSKLYGYTNDEQGIRHALLDKDSPDVGLDEAMFMFGACASFAAYLVNKHQQMKQQEDDN